jgi:hypothetical protein
MKRSFFVKDLCRRLASSKAELLPVEYLHVVFTPKLEVWLVYENEIPQPGQLTPDLLYLTVGSSMGFGKQYLFDGMVRVLLETERIISVPPKE